MLKKTRGSELGDVSLVQSGNVAHACDQVNGASGCLEAWPIKDLAPLKYIIAARMRESERRHRIQPIVELYGSSLLAAMRAASLL